MFIVKSTDTCRLIAFDYGTNRIGVASGQTLIESATPLPSIKHGRRNPDWIAIDDLLGRWRPQLLLVGLPLNMDGTEGSLCQPARKFAEKLEQRSGLPVELVDERLSTREAYDRKERFGGGDIDSLAAQVIAETWLNREKRSHALPPTSASSPRFKCPR